MTRESDYYEKATHWGVGATSDDRNLARLRETIALIPADVTTAADAGAGDGELARELRDRGLHLVSMDRSGEAIRHAPSPRIRSSIDQIPLASASVDLVLACEVLEHLPPTVLAKGLSELVRVSRRYVLVTVPNAEDLSRGMVVCASCGCRFHANRHLRSFDEASMADLIPGMKPVSVRTIGPLEPRFPRAITAMAHRVGLASTTSHVAVPSCPQCGESALRNGILDPVAPSPSTRRQQLRSTLRHRLPVPRHRSWLAALYARR